MSEGDGQRAAPTVFLSYASEDREAAKLIRDGVQACGLEVWYDESGLDGGDAWDQKIRRQIRDCDFFMAVISAQTAARPEGYFRREWRLAVERTQDMADDHTFLLPIVIDETTQAGARVPDRFLSVQWLRLPGGQSTAALEALCRRLAAGQAAALPPPTRTPVEPPPAAARAAPAPDFPDFPRAEPGQRLRYGAQVLGWSLQSAWMLFRRLPRWVRILVYVWLAVVLLSRACTPSGHEHAARLSQADARKLKEITDAYQGSANKDDIGKLATQIAREFSQGGKPPAHSALLAIPFRASPGDAAAQKLADSAFAQVYGRLAIARHGQVDLAQETLASADAAAAVALARAQHASYVLYGSVASQPAAPQQLSIALVGVADGAVLWSDSSPLSSADPARIAAAVDDKVPPAEDNN